MIQYQEEPIPEGQRLRIAAWLGSREAEEFKQCASAQLHQHYIDAIISQEKSEEEGDRFCSQSKRHLQLASEVRIFLTVLDRLSSPKYSLHHIKTNVQ